MGRRVYERTIHGLAFGSERSESGCFSGQEGNKATDSKIHIPGLGRGRGKGTPAPHELGGFSPRSNKAALSRASTPAQRRVRIGHQIREGGMNE